MKETFTTILDRPIVKVNLRARMREKLRDPVAIDSPFNLYLNGEYVATIFALPVKLKELAVGYLMDEGILKSKEEIANIRIKRSDIKVKAKSPVKIRPHALHSFVKAFPHVQDGLKNCVTVKVNVSSKQILQMILKLNRLSTTFKATGGTHSAAIFRLNNGKMVSFAEDVGRHNTVDKVIGESILSGVNLSRCLLASTARQSASMVLKTARVGIPVVVSKASPLFSGIHVAEKTGITLICFVRGHRMNIYTHQERVR